MSYQPILEDAAQIASLDGQRFVVLRAPEAVAAQWGALQQSLRSELTNSIFYPAAAHVTLTGFVAGTPLDALTALVRSWASQTPTLQLDAELIDTFPPPAQVASIRVRRTSELAAALGALRERAAAAGLVVSSSVQLDQWVPRMSLAYGGRLDVPAWLALQERTQAVPWSVVSGEVTAAEVLAFDAGQEHSGGRFPLGVTGVSA